MKLIINIPEKEYNIAKCGQYGNINVDVVRKALANGTLIEQEPSEDCIRREDAINTAIDAVDEWDGGCNTNRATMISKAIKKIPSVQPQQEWISCSERLPKKYTYTLWCASSGYVSSDYFNGEYWEDAKKFCYDVIAWMPLPEPYEESEDTE